jgi:hypothetical protein
MSGGGYLVVNGVHTGPHQLASGDERVHGCAIEGVQGGAVLRHRLVRHLGADKDECNARLQR